MNETRLYPVALRPVGRNVLREVLWCLAGVVVFASGCGGGERVASQGRGQEARSEKSRSGVYLTAAAAGAVKQVISEQSLAPDSVLRPSVTGGGCTGFVYDLQFDERSNPESDVQFESHAVRIVVSKASMAFLDGTVIDFYDGVERRGFTFDNPNAINSTSPPKNNLP